MAAIQWLINKVFGRTHMFVVLLSWFLIITGLLMLWKPAQARASMAGRGFGIIKGYVLALVLFIGALLVSVTGKMSGLLAFVILIAGIALLFKGFAFFTKTAANKVNDWVEKIPLIYLRVYAAVQVIIGIGMHIARQRILY
jgi:hypothetical protein